MFTESVLTRLESARWFTRVGESVSRKPSAIVRMTFPSGVGWKHAFDSTIFWLR